jgi:hypothetical protein
MLGLSLVLVEYLTSPYTLEGGARGVAVRGVAVRMAVRMAARMAAHFRKVLVEVLTTEAHDDDHAVGRSFFFNEPTDLCISHLVVLRQRV